MDIGRYHIERSWKNMAKSFYPDGLIKAIDQVADDIESQLGGTDTQSDYPTFYPNEAVEAVYTVGGDIVSALSGTTVATDYPTYFPDELVEAIYERGEDIIEAIGQGGGGGGGSSDYTEATITFYNEENFDRTPSVIGPCTMKEASGGVVENSTEVVSTYEVTVPQGANGLPVKITLYKGHALINLKTLNTVVYGGIDKISGTAYAIVRGDCEVSYE